LLPESPADGVGRFGARERAAACLELATAVIESWGPVAAIGISNQRGSTVVWDRAPGEPVGPGIGWQDLRTIGQCLALRGEGVRASPNQSATKLQGRVDPLPPPARAAGPRLGTRRTRVA